MTDDEMRADQRGHLAGPDGCWSWDASHWPCAVSLIRAQQDQLAVTAAAGSSEQIAEARRLARVYYLAWRDELGRHVDVPHASGLPTWLTEDVAPE